MKKPVCVVVGLLSLVGLGKAIAVNAAPINEWAVSPVLDELLTFHPSWVTRSVTSHDPQGDNGDGSGDGNAREGEYHVLFHGKGEGRITRIWMTDNLDGAIAQDWKELWIQIDGKTVYRGTGLDFFAGKGAWQAPLVLDFHASSGGFLSYVPFPYQHEAKVLMLGSPHYFQVTYRQGVGASKGPSSEQLSKFMSERWWEGSLDRGPERLGHVEAAVPAVLAKGQAVVSGFALTLDRAEDLRRLRVRIGNQAPVPVSFFFGLGSAGDEKTDGGWASITSAIHHVNPQNRYLATRLPIPLQKGDRISVEIADRGKVDFRYRLLYAEKPRPGVSLITQYRDQSGPGRETTMPFFESRGSTQFVSLIEGITEGRPAERNYLEGDEMIRTDQLSYPFQLGTGTEDYFNGGWYFLGIHSNPMSGQPRFEVLDPEDGWSHAHFEHSLYRNHLADPVVGRAGVRFGMEAGETGAYSPVRYRTLGLGYGFSGLIEYAKAKVSVGEIRGSGLTGRETISSAVDAEHSQQPVSFESRFSRGESVMTFNCDSRQKPSGLFLIRAYDAMKGDQEAQVRVNGRGVGVLFEAYSNPFRRYAQDGIWVDLLPHDCVNGSMDIEVDSSGGGLWSEAGYEAVFYTTGG